MTGITSRTARMLALVLMLATLPAVAQEASDKSAEGININTADAGRLAENLHGVGPAKAEAIISYREEEGRFTTPEHLEEVDGIGPQTVSDNREKIRLD